ncbi:uncharacterized protein DUF429 [Sphaerotilus hippei]|uniref:Uncharacterized protein DUF429 n=1 Tax=Sphaerotilus hippei TaxID=744406 RepID=A0A318H518_9BURK|nr:DUF429 domain-containing protein [Sphaerotilus hippei]PXW98833.1 uncharacterized protein DUF429 [Sphaerotilus hippei]
MAAPADRPAPGGTDAPAPPGLSLRGVDFSSRPSRRKAITMAIGQRCGTRVLVDRLRRFHHLDDWAASLDEPGPWRAGMDLPFGLPRELVTTLGWPTDWSALMRHYAALDRAVIRDRFKTFCAARPVGGKFAHRACDGPAGASPSMKWVNPPVAWMLHAGVPRLIAAGCDLPGLRAGDGRRQALEAYPGLLARELIGRTSYKSDDRQAWTEARRQARITLVKRLEQGAGRLALQLVAEPALRAELIDDASGDALDAVLCLVQVAWSVTRPGHGWPAGVDPLEGWILTA